MTRFVRQDKKSQLGIEKKGIQDLAAAAPDTLTNKRTSNQAQKERDAPKEILHWGFSRRDQDI